MTPECQNPNCKNIFFILVETTYSSLCKVLEHLQSMVTIVNASVGWVNDTQSGKLRRFALAKTYVVYQSPTGWSDLEKQVRVIAYKNGDTTIYIYIRYSKL